MKFKLSPNWQDQFNFDAIDLANLFVNKTKSWYDEEFVGEFKQGLFGKKDAVFAVIVDFLENGKYPETVELIYALNKFCNEWLEEIFIEYREKL